MDELTGIAGSPGKGAGKIFRVNLGNDIAIGSVVTENLPPNQQLSRFQKAYTEVKSKLVSLAQDSAIFSAHTELLEDLSESIVTKIEQQKADASSAVMATCEEVYALFSEIDDEYLRARSDDITDICRQLVHVLEGKSSNPFSGMPSNTILVADNLLPSDTVLIDFSKIAGIALKKGSHTSHLAILCRNNGVPLVLGVGNPLDELSDGTTVVVDGDKGNILIHPEHNLLEEIIKTKESPEKSDPNPATTKEGVPIKVYANAGSLFDVEQAMARGADGIGLLRTEFIFMEGTHFPDEDEQYRIYLACAKICQNKPLTIRTLDIGADKQLPYHTMQPEKNPALGLRGIRFSLAFPALFKVQLRAILRASLSGNIRFMFPMITDMEEYQQALTWVETCKKELKDEGEAFDDSLMPGIMIETPASVFLADDFAPIMPFFSIGTNDLTQYILAVDRENPYSDEISDRIHPALIKSLEKVAETAKRQGTDISVCGELASDPQVIALLIRLGITKLSVTSRNIPMLKEQIRKL